MLTRGSEATCAETRNLILFFVGLIYANIGDWISRTYLIRHRKLWHWPMKVHMQNVCIYQYAWQGECVLKCIPCLFVVARTLPLPRTSGHPTSGCLLHAPFCHSYLFAMHIQKVLWMWVKKLHNLIFKKCKPWIPNVQILFKTLLLSCTVQGLACWRLAPVKLDSL